MSKKVKKGLTIAGLAVDAAITIFLFVVSIILISKTAGLPDQWALREETGFIGYLINHSNVYLFTCVIPLFILLAVNIILLVMYVKGSSKQKDLKVADLTDEQKEALKKQLMEELKK